MQDGIDFGIVSAGTLRYSSRNDILKTRWQRRIQRDGEERFHNPYMCGIFGYAGNGRNASEAVLEGLKRLEYRGYDSWGIGVVEDGVISLDKHVGMVGIDAGTLPESSIGIGHTRWATHGKVTDTNAHPHYASDRSFVLAHNGIVENAPALKRQLEKDGYKFISETDTEVIVRLAEKKLLKARCVGRSGAARLQRARRPQYHHHPQDRRRDHRRAQRLPARRGHRCKRRHLFLIGCLLIRAAREVDPRPRQRADGDMPR